MIGIFEDDHRRFAREYRAENPQGAECKAVAENPGLIVAAVLNEESEIVA